MLTKPFRRLSMLKNVHFNKGKVESDEIPTWFMNFPLLDRLEMLPSRKRDFFFFFHSVSWCESTNTPTLTNVLLIPPNLDGCAALLSCGIYFPSTQSCMASLPPTDARPRQDLLLLFLIKLFDGGTTQGGATGSSYTVAMQPSTTQSTTQKA